MATLDARSSSHRFDMSNGGLVNFVTSNSASSTQYSWDTSGDSSGINRVHASGVGITVDPGTQVATGGSIDQVGFQFEFPGTVEAIISTPFVPLTDLVSPAGANAQDAADKFWARLLSGDDQIFAPDIGSGLLFGDFLRVLSTVGQVVERTGGNDLIQATSRFGSPFGALSRGGLGAPDALVGDAYLVNGAEFNNIAYTGTLIGGNDTILLSNRPAYFLIGDVWQAGTLGDVFGGADVIQSDAVPATIGGFSAPDLLVGDVGVNNGFVIGGADNITGSNFAFLDEILAGDVFRQQSGTTHGGADTISGRRGHDYIAGDVAMLGGTLVGGADVIRGGEDSDIIAGDVLQAGNDGQFGSLEILTDPVVQVTGGSDTLYGEGGDDVIAGDVWDLAQIAAGSSFQCGDDVIYGGEGNDLIYGDVTPLNVFLPSPITVEGGNDVIDGGPGFDAMFGGGGDDWYFVDNAKDVVTDRAGQGTLDRVFVSTSWVLTAGSEIENLATTNNAGTDAINLTGNELANLIYGNAGNNILDGKGAADRMIGMGGNDSYHVDNAGDMVTDGVGQGTADRVFASVSWTLTAGAEIENLATSSNSGTAAINLTGNELANLIFGNAGNNILDGKAGADQMVGMIGNDSYQVDNAGDVVTDTAGQGTADRVFASVSWTLTAGAEIENLSTSSNGSTAAINLTGNERANLIFGNAGANVLDGRAGADTLVGMVGNDTFVFRPGEANGDIVNDFAGNGSSAGDTLQFAGYGAGATFTIIDATHWQVNYNGGVSHDVITFSNAATVHASDYAFV